MALINDFRGTRRGAASAHYCPCWVDGWPAVVVVATEALAAGDEVLVDYGDRWWHDAPARSPPG
jgi:hypothetical protein